MKKISLIVGGLLLAMPFVTSAQYRAGDQEASLSYGRESGTDILSGFELGRTAPNYDHPSYNSPTAKSGNIFLSYEYFLISRLGIGVTAGTEFVSYDHYSNNDIQPGGGGAPHSLLASYKTSITTLAFEIIPVYLNGGLVQLYGIVGVGARYATEKQVSDPGGISYTEFHNPYFLNTQWTPIGVHVGKTLSGFLELGVGYKGLINGGISYKLCHKAKAAVAAKPE